MTNYHPLVGGLFGPRDDSTIQIDVELRQYLDEYKLARTARRAAFNALVAISIDDHAASRQALDAIHTAELVQNKLAVEIIEWILIGLDEDES